MEKKPRNEKDYGGGFSESNRKTRAFYITMAALIGLFVYGDIKAADTEIIINALSNLALVYIGGVAVADSVRYYKYGSKTLSNPEKQEELKERYKDR